MVDEVARTERDTGISTIQPYFRAIALDFDGTLTEHGRPSDSVLGALQEVRDAGLAVLLVTGRVVTDLLHVFPDVEETFDTIVAENGAVIRAAGVSHALTAPVPVELDGALISQGVDFQRGQVLLACHSKDELAVLREVRRLGADCQMIRNRDALMLLPSEISKGTGLIEALESLGVSHHSAIGIGDAENDLALLRQCELGVAVGNAVPSLKRAADIVLEGRAGYGVERFLRDVVLTGSELPASRRWKAVLGKSADGKQVTIPSSQTNLIVVGGGGVGKSYAAGLFAERLIELDYSVCVLDPEGDHAPLRRLRNVVVMGGRRSLPPAETIGPLLGSKLGSLVIDLSLSPEQDRQPYVADALASLSSERSRCGLPHWIVVDEAHILSGAHARTSQRQKGLCLVTYDAHDVFRSPSIDFDYVVAVAGRNGIEATVAADLAKLLPNGGLDALPTQVGEVLLVELGDSPCSQVVTLDRRFVDHVRHWHKYAISHLPSGSTFRFRTIDGPTGAHADNLAAFRREILLCDLGVLQHHAAHRDFSRWIEESIRDEGLARRMRDLEQQAEARGAFDELRRSVVEAVEDRYLG